MPFLGGLRRQYKRLRAERRLSSAHGHGSSEGAGGAEGPADPHLTTTIRSPLSHPSASLPTSLQAGDGATPTEKDVGFAQPKLQGLSQPQSSPNHASGFDNEIVPVMGFIDVLPQPLPNQPRPAPIHAIPASSVYTSQTGSPTSLSYFSNAHHLHIPRLHINNIQYQGSFKTLFDCLEPHVAHGAAHNSDERCDAPRCYPETRVAVQEEIVGWMGNGGVHDEPKPIMWLSGPAGSGKTAIAGSVAETCKKLGLLAASFFFSSSSGSEDRRSKRFLITTIANHLAEHDTLLEYKVQLLWSIERHPGIFRKNLKEQAECLILKPLREIQGQCDGSAWPKGMILDGLDEVEAEQYHDPTRQGIARTHDEDQLEILDVLFTLSQDPAFPFRILIASRPERIIDEFSHTTAATSTIKLFLDSKYDPDADIRSFLNSKFASIRRRSGISDPLWPGQPAVDWIIEKSSGQFAVPAAITRYVGAGLPQQRLEEIMHIERVNAVAKNPLAPLDALYSHILKRSPNPHLAIMWIQSFLVANSSVGSEPLPALFWRQFLETEDGETNHLLGDLASLIFIPSADDRSSQFNIYHRSVFIDFLKSQTRCGELHNSAATVNRYVAGLCVNVLQNKGPSVKLPPGTELAWFLDHFLDLSPFIYELPDVDLFESPCPKFLSYLDDSSKNALAACDVAWWTRLLLTGALGSGDQDEEMHEALQSHSILRGIYCGVHTICEPGSPCHTACIRWRKQIMASASSLGEWCPHEIELVDVNDLCTLSEGDWDDLTSPLQCPAC